MDILGLKKSALTLSFSYTLFVTTSQASCVTWPEFSMCDTDRPVCTLVLTHLKSDYEVSNDAYKDGLTSIKPDVGYATYDINKDSLDDVIGFVSSTISCGAGARGCPTAVLLKNSDGTFKRVYDGMGAPYIGFANNGDIVFASGAPARYPVWRLKNDKYEFLEIRNQECPSEKTESGN